LCPRRPHGRHPHPGPPPKGEGDRPLSLNTYNASAFRRLRVSIPFAHSRPSGSQKPILASLAGLAGDSHLAAFGDSPRYAPVSPVWPVSPASGGGRCQMQLCNLQARTLMFVVRALARILKPALRTPPRLGFHLLSPPPPPTPPVAGRDAATNDKEDGPDHDGAKRRDGPQVYAGTPLRAAACGSAAA